MTSPYLLRRLRSLDEAMEDRQFRNLRNRHKMIDLANRKAEVSRTDNVYRLGPRLVTKFGARS